MKDFSKVSPNLDRALHGIHHAGKLRLYAVAGGTDYAASMVLYEGIGHLTVGSESMQGADLVRAHEAAVTLDVSSEKRR